MRDHCEKHFFELAQLPSHSYQLDPIIQNLPLLILNKIILIVTTFLPYETQNEHSMEREKGFTARSLRLLPARIMSADHFALGTQLCEPVPGSHTILFVYSTLTLLEHSAQAGEGMYSRRHIPCDLLRAA